MMVNDDGNEENMHGNEDEEEEEDEEEQVQEQYIEEVHQTGPSRRSRRSMKQSNQQQQQIVYVKANQNGDEEEDEGTTIYIQSAEDVEEEMVSGDVTQFINGSVVTSEAGEQFIISTNAESGDIQATPIMIELKKEHTDEDVEVEHSLVEHVDEREGPPEEQLTGQYIVNNAEYS